MKRGKKLTFAQRNILTQNKITDPDDYLYLKMETVSDDGDKHLKQNSSKIQRIVVIHKESGEIKKINI